MKRTRWVEKPEILSYIIDCYQGVEKDNGARKRQFIWETSEGNIVIGNSRAFYIHITEKFGMATQATSWSEIHTVLHELGEIVNEYSPRVNKKGGKFKNQVPETRIIKRKES